MNAVRRAVGWLRAASRADAPSLVDFVILGIAAIAVYLRDVPELLFLVVVVVQRLTFLLVRQGKGHTTNNFIIQDPRVNPRG